MLKRIQTIYGELDNSYASQRRFVADASHELRTPLTTITGNAEFLKKIWTSLDNHPSRLPEEEEIRISVEARLLMTLRMKQQEWGDWLMISWHSPERMQVFE